MTPPGAPASAGAPTGPGGHPSRLRVGALYVGGFLGPFGGGVVASMLPEIGASYHVSASTATATITAYLVPFAGLMLVSGTVGERIGRGRAILLAYVGYALASLLAAAAGTFGVLLLARALQGTANAFTTPLLLAALADEVPTARLGRAVGLYSAVTALGQTGAPLLGGLAASVNWRWAFVGSAIAAGALALVAPQSRRRSAATPPRLRTAWRGPVLRTALAGAVAGCCLAGLAFLVAARAQDAFGLAASARGLLLTGFGLVGLVAGPVVGRYVDRYGPRACGRAGCVAGGAAVAVLGVVPGWLGLAIGWAVCGAASQLVLVSLNAVILTEVPENRGGALSVLQSLRFAGSAAAPPLWLPVYGVSPALGFVAPGALLATAGVRLLRRR